MALNTGHANLFTFYSKKPNLPFTSQEASINQETKKGWMNGAKIQKKSLRLY